MVLREINGVYPYRLGNPLVSTVPRCRQPGNIQKRANVDVIRCPMRNSFAFKRLLGQLKGPRFGIFAVAELT